MYEQGQGRACDTPVWALVSGLSIQVSLLLREAGAAQSKGSRESRLGLRWGAQPVGPSEGQFPEREWYCGRSQAPYGDRLDAQASSCCCGLWGQGPSRTAGQIWECSRGE